MKNSFIKVLSFVMALTMIVGCFTAISFSAAECNHTKGAKGETKAPTCVKPGFTWYTCATCGEQYMDDITAATGVHTEVVDPATDATCTSPAKTAGKKCSVCNKVLEEKKPVTGSQALGHNMVVKEKAATCTTQNESYYQCTRCNKTAKELGLLAQYPTTSYGDPATGHDYVYTVVVAPTLCTDGQVTVTCKNCDYSKTVTANAKHDYKPFTNSGDTCAAYTSGEKCAACGNIKNGVANEEIKHTWVRVTGMNATVEAMGYKNAAELYKAPTCTAAGYKVERCTKCNVYATNEIEALGHTLTWSFVKAEKKNDDASICKTAAKRVGTCARYADCKYTEEIIETEAIAHDIKTEVVAPTCVNLAGVEYSGYTRTYCGNKGCTYEVLSGFQNALGHTWSDWEYTGNCEIGITATRECTVEGCDATETTTTAVTDHNMTTGSVVKPVAATCQTKAHYVYYCQNAHCDHVEVVADSYYGELDTANHQDLTFSFTKKAATCTATGIDSYICACKATVEKTSDLAEHVKGTVYSKDNKVVVDVTAVAPNCKANGKTEGVCCTKCGKIFKAQETVVYDPAKHAHKDTAPVKHGAEVAATCLEAGYQMYYYSCCGYVKVETAPVSETHTWKSRGFKAPTCTEEGWHGHTYCTVCGFVRLSTIVANNCTLNCGDDVHAAMKVTGNYKIPATGHDMEDVEAVPETCTVDGTTAHKACKNCDYTVGKRTVPAHGDKYKTEVKAAEATCVATGKNAVAKGDLCTVCDKDQIEIPKLAHNFASNVTEVTTNDCTKPTYKIYACTNGCNASYAADFVPGKEAHNYELSWHKVAANDNGVVIDSKTQNVIGYACQVGTYEYRKCVNCDQVVKQNEKAAISHYFFVDGTTKVEIKLDCKNIAEFNGHTCALCGHKVVADASKAVAGDLIVAHNYKTTTKAATCTAGGYTITACAACGDVKVNTPSEALGHAVKYIIEEVAATNSKDGYKKYMCSRCNTEVTEVLTANDSIVLNVKAAGAAVANNQVKLNVTLSASKYAFNEIKFKINKDNAQVALADVAVAVDYAFAATDAVTAVASDNGSYIEVLVYVPNGADGKAKNVTVSGTDAAFLTITLDVLATANGDTAIATDDAAIVDVAYIDNGAAKHKADKASIKATTFKTSVIGDVNGDSKLDAGDSIVIQSAIYAGTYNVAADFDKNGKVDLADHVAFIKFVTSRQSVIDYLAVMGITVEGIVADMKLAYDLDFDRAVGTDNDKAVLVAYVASALANVNYAEFADNYDGSIVDLINDVAYGIASGNMGI